MKSRLENLRISTQCKDHANLVRFLKDGYFSSTLVFIP